MIFNTWGGKGAVRTQKWRAVKTGKGWALYNMSRDAAQEHNLAAEHPDVVKQLSDAYEKWWADVSQDGFDPIPTEIGHAERPTIELPGHEALLPPGKPGISYGGKNGWANDYVTNWTSTDAAPRWPVRVVQGGQYAVTLIYACEASDVGSKLAVTFGDARLEAVIDRAHDAVEIPAGDRVGRKEVPERRWGELPIGTIQLAPGDGDLVLHALTRPGEQVATIKAIRLSRISDRGSRK
jgi:hypothetical protein